MDESSENDEHSRWRTVLSQLEQLFPNHGQQCIKTVVRDNTWAWMSDEECLQICIEQLVRIAPSPTSYNSRDDESSLSRVQCQVLEQLKEYFPQHDVKVLRTSVCHPDNLCEPLAQHTLLQRCLDDLLEGRTAGNINAENVEDDENKEETKNTLKSQIQQVRQLQLGQISETSVDDENIDEVNVVRDTKDDIKVTTDDDIEDLVDEKPERKLPDKRKEMNSPGIEKELFRNILDCNKENSKSLQKSLPEKVSTCLSKDDAESDTKEKLPARAEQASFSLARDDLFSTTTLDSDISNSESASNESFILSSDESESLPELSFRKKGQDYFESTLQGPTSLTIHRKRKASSDVEGALKDLVQTETESIAKELSPSFYEYRSPKVKKPRPIAMTSPSSNKHTPSFKDFFARLAHGSPKSGTSCEKDLPVSTVNWSQAMERIPHVANSQQQTVTIQSTHKIIYSTPVTCSQGSFPDIRSRDIGIASSTPKFTVHLPLNPPDISLTAAMGSTAFHTETGMKAFNNSSSGDQSDHFPQFEKCDGCKAYFPYKELASHQSHCEWLKASSASATTTSTSAARASAPSTATSAPRASASSTATSAPMASASSTATSAPRASASSTATSAPRASAPSTGTSAPRISASAHRIAILDPSASPSASKASTSAPRASATAPRTSSSALRDPSILLQHPNQQFGTSLNTWLKPSEFEEGMKYCVRNKNGETFNLQCKNGVLVKRNGFQQEQKAEFQEGHFYTVRDSTGRSRVMVARNGQLQSFNKPKSRQKCETITKAPDDEVENQNQSSNTDTTSPGKPAGASVDGNAPVLVGNSNIFQTEQRVGLPTSGTLKGKAPKHKAPVLKLNAKCDASLPHSHSQPILACKENQNLNPVKKITEIDEGMQRQRVTGHGIDVLEHLALTGKVLDKTGEPNFQSRYQNNRLLIGMINDDIVDLEQASNDQKVHDGNANQRPGFNRNIKPIDIDIEPVDDNMDVAYNVEILNDVLDLTKEFDNVKKKVGNRSVAVHLPDEDVIDLEQEVADNNEDNGPVLVHANEDKGQAAAVDNVGVKDNVLALFPDVDPDFLERLCREHNGPMAVNNICLALLEEDYPRRQDGATAAPVVTSPAKVSVDYYRDYQSLGIPQEISHVYVAQAFQLLSEEFSWIAAADIKFVMKKVFSWYAASHRALQTIWAQAVEAAQKISEKGAGNGVTFGHLKFVAKVPADQIGGKEWTGEIKLLKNRRPQPSRKKEIINELSQEIEYIKNRLKASEVEKDYKIAMAINEQEYEEEGQSIECGCCYAEYPFERMVQCYEGHLFCESCLKNYVKESVFGSGKANLSCMTDLCDSTFPKSQLIKALPSDMFLKYEDRITEENLNLADLGDLVKCPHCDFRAFMDEQNNVFSCQAESCRQVTCRHCQVDWSEHFGKKCSEVEKKDETQIRVQYEEKMTKAKVRVCHGCKAQFMKESGCNKMTCRCGAKMCYICREPNIDYNHFCRHPRDPGKLCETCTACSLWSNPEEDDNRAVAEIQKEAEQERIKKGFVETKVIGVPDQPAEKKKT